MRRVIVTFGGGSFAVRAEREDPAVIIEEHRQLRELERRLAEARESRAAFLTALRVIAGGQAVDTRALARGVLGEAEKRERPPIVREW